MASFAAPLALRSFEYWMFQYRRTWRGSIVSTVLFPVLFLASMGLGLGTLVDASSSRGVEGHSYLVFLAPGLLAATAMQTGVGESSYPVMAAIKWVKTYHAMLATRSACSTSWSATCSTSRPGSCSALPCSWS